MSFRDEMHNVQQAVVDTFREKELVTLYPADDPWTPIEVAGIFDDDATFLLVGEDVVYSSSSPLLGLIDREQERKRGDEVEVRGKRYRAVDTRPDGQGFTVLVLEAVS